MAVRPGGAEWMASEQDGGPLDVLEGNDVDLLVDDEQFLVMEEAVGKARDSIDLLQLWFAPGFKASPGAVGYGKPLVEGLLDADRRGVAVRILLNENAVVRDSVDEIRAYFANAAPNHVQVRDFLMSPNALHAKVLVVDGKEAFVIGPPFQQRFWDTPRHLPHEPRRDHPRPCHDQSLRLRGSAVEHVQRFFDTLWNLREGGPIPGGSFPTPASSGSRVQIVRTLPAGLFPGREAGEKTILASYLQAIANARRFIYLENQYFTNRTIVEALREAMAREHRLEVILVINEETDIPTYIAWQRTRLREMGWPHARRLGVFTLHSPLAGNGWSSVPLYLHSKLGIVDDVWLTVGSANLDSFSLETADEFLVPLKSNVELNAVLLEEDGTTGRIPAWRRRVWAEHLGDQGVWGPRPPEGGWLAWWRRVAEANARAVRDGGPMQGHVMPYLPPEEGGP